MEKELKLSNADYRLLSIVWALKLLRAYRCVIISILVYINYYYSIRLF
jgi:hypothetical protein